VRTVVVLPVPPFWERIVMVVPTRDAKILLAAIACLISAGCGDDPPPGTAALDQARQRLMDAPRVVITRGPRVESYAPPLNVIEEKGRVLNWANRRVEHYWLEDRSCYDTSHAFERADFRDQRRGAVPEASSARLEERSGRTLIRWRLEDQERAPDVEGSVLLDDDGRPVLVTARALPWAGEPARPASRTRISYPGRIVAPRPSPLCSAL
jgi:hypothetical protein